MAKRIKPRKRRDRRESEHMSPYTKSAKSPFKYPFPTGSNYALAVSRGEIGDPGERWRAK